MKELLSGLLKVRKRGPDNEFQIRSKAIEHCERDKYGKMGERD